MYVGVIGADWLITYHNSTVYQLFTYDRSVMRTKKEKLKILITVKTYPIPSAKYNELVCTTGVTEDGDFVRLYPINFRDLPFSRQYKKYQWIEVVAQRHSGRDTRKESYRPDCDTICTLSEPIPTSHGDWSEREKYVLKNKARSIEELWDEQRKDNTSLGIFKPKRIIALAVKEDTPDWKPSFKAKLQQMNIWETKTTKEPPRKVPFKFVYRFECNDHRCNGHRMMIEDWEVGALFWRLVDEGASSEEAADRVQRKFLKEICGPNKDTHFYVGNVLKYPRSWIVLGVFWPTIGAKKRFSRATLNLFHDNSDQ